MQPLVEHDQLQAVHVEVLSDHAAVVEDEGSSHNRCASSSRLILVSGVDDTVNIAPR
jgi:hypothetical protein